jgi:hypothetical protein
MQQRFLFKDNQNAPKAMVSDGSSNIRIFRQQQQDGEIQNSIRISRMKRKRSDRRQDRKDCV